LNNPPCGEKNAYVRLESMLLIGRRGILKVCILFNDPNCIVACLKPPGKALLV